MGQVVKLQRAANGMVEAMKDMIERGDVFEVIMFAPNKSGQHWHFHTSPGIRLSDVLVAKQYLTMLANALCEAGTTKTPPEKAA